MSKDSKVSVSINMPQALRDILASMARRNDEAICTVVVRLCAQALGKPALAEIGRRTPGRKPGSKT